MPHSTSRSPLHSQLFLKKFFFSHPTVCGVTNRIPDTSQQNEAYKEMFTQRIGLLMKRLSVHSATTGRKFSYSWRRISTINLSAKEQQTYWWSPSLLLIPLLGFAPTISLLYEGETQSLEDSAISGNNSEGEAEEKGWVALYLDKSSQEELKKHIKQHAFQNVTAKYLTLQFNPNEEDYALIADAVGVENFQIEPVALVTSTTVQVLYCDIVGQLKKKNTDLLEDHDEVGGRRRLTIKFDARVTSQDMHPHVVMSSSEPVGDRVDIQAMLARVAAASLLDLARNSEEFLWSGMLPAVEGGGVPMRVSVQGVAGFTLNSTVCTNFRWDDQTLSCKPPGECGFCKFMRAGPCGDVFTAWEDCIDTCKKDDTDFVDICGAQTMSLKECVDAHSEYYGVLGEEPETVEVDAQ